MSIKVANRTILAGPTLLIAPLLTAYGPTVPQSPQTPATDLNGSYEFKVGPAATTDCAVTKDYQPHRRQPMRHDAPDGPQKLCIRYLAEADNFAPQP